MIPSAAAAGATQTAVVAATVAAVATGLAVLLASPARSRGRPGGGPGDGEGAVPRWLPVVAVGAVAAVAGTVLTGTAVVVVVLAAGSAAAGLRLLTARRARLEAARTSVRVLETCEQLAAELAAGQPPGTALDRAADDWAPLRPVAATFRIGGDVPAGLRQAAARRGAGDLRYVAAAWQVAHSTGSGLGDAVDRVALDLRAAAATRRVVDGELSSARATSRLVAALPVVALLMGSGAGGDPWGFLLGHPVGLACLAAGLGLGFLGLWWIEALATGVEGRDR